MGDSLVEKEQDNEKNLQTLLDSIHEKEQNFQSALHAVESTNHNQERKQKIEIMNLQKTVEDLNKKNHTKQIRINHLSAEMSKLLSSHSSLILMCTGNAV